MEAMIPYAASSAAGAWPWAEQDWDTRRVVSGFVGSRGALVRWDDLQLSAPEREAFESASVAEIERIVRRLGPWPRRES